jgi:hypothetical protein
VAGILNIITWFMKILYKSEIEIKEDLWIYEFCFDVVHDDGRKVRVFAGISGGDLLEYLNWQEDENGERPTEQHLNKWVDSVIEKYTNEDEKCYSEICFYAQNNNEHVLDYLHSSLKS